MYDRAQTTGIFNAAQSGLQNTLQYLLQNNKDGINRTNLNNAMYNNVAGTNSAFFQMISGQFTTLDKNNDGVLSADEANNMLSNLSSGLSRDQILQLKNAGGIDDEMASKIISNFSKIDKNGDGVVSESEINAYFMNEDIQEKRDEQMKRIISNMSCYYDVDEDGGVSSGDDV